MLSSDIFQDKTPIEKHLVRGRRVFVKRDDLYGRAPAPPLGKLRGLRRVVEKLSANGNRVFGCWDTRFSKLGQGLAALCATCPDLKAVVSYPASKAYNLPHSIAEAERLGAMLLPLPANHVAICYAMARKRVEALGGHMLPFGLECAEAVEAIAAEAAAADGQLFADGTVVVSCGSGVTRAGLINGLCARPQKLIGISSGRSLDAITSCLRRHCARIPDCLELRPAATPYSHEADFPCPFPAHRNYDLKAWQFLEENLSALPSPVLFWNVGA